MDKRKLHQAKRNSAEELYDDYRFLDYSIQVFEDTKVKNRPIGFVWDNPKLIVMPK